MFRLFFMTFGGKGGAVGGLWGGSAQYRGEGHPHEAPWVMTIPLMILAVPAVFAGFWGVNNGFASFLTAGAVTSSTWVNALTDPLTWFGVGLAVVGIALAWLMYGLEVIPAKAVHRQSGWARSTPCCSTSTISTSSMAGSSRSSSWASPTARRSSTST